MMSARNYQIDPKLLTAILMDEYARMEPQDLADHLSALGYNTSSGLAQVKLSTAKNLIKKGYFKAKKNISDLEIYKILNSDQGAIKMAAAYLKFVIDHRRKKKLKISLEILISSYSSGKNVKIATKRGVEVANKMLRLSEKVLK